jgi:hypothetical protein
MIVDPVLKQSHVIVAIRVVQQPALEQFAICRACCSSNEVYIDV